MSDGSHLDLACCSPFCLDVGCIILLYFGALAPCCKICYCCIFSAQMSGTNVNVQLEKSEPRCEKKNPELYVYICQHNLIRRACECHK